MRQRNISSKNDAIETLKQVLSYFLSLTDQCLFILLQLVFEHGRKERDLNQILYMNIKSDHK